jgi:hypothetical protein
MNMPIAKTVILKKKPNNALFIVLHLLYLLPLTSLMKSHLFRALKNEPSRETLC